MDEEYDDYKIGELDEEDVGAKDKIEKKVLDDAVDEFIMDTKKRFTNLAKEFGNEEANNLIPATKTSDLIYAEDLKDGDEPAEVKQKLREKKLQNAQVFEEEALENMEDVPDRDQSEEEDAWDAETILSTYTNTDNHPGVIKT